MSDDKQFYHSGEPLFDSVCSIYVKTAGDPIKQALKILREAGFLLEVSAAEEWLKEQRKRLKGVCGECCGDCMNCGVMPVSIEIEGVLR